MKRFIKYLIFAALILGNVWAWTGVLKGCSSNPIEQDDEREPLPENVALVFFLS